MSWYSIMIGHLNGIVCHGNVSSFMAGDTIESVLYMYRRRNGIRKENVLCYGGQSSGDVLTLPESVFCLLF